MTKSLYIMIPALLILGCNGQNDNGNGEIVIGDVPQDVEDEFIEEPAGVNVEIWQENLDIPWSIAFLPNGDANAETRERTTTGY
ncbi:MAG: hypothetical protein WD038_03790 [Balneolales bacterium]